MEQSLGFISFVPWHFVVSILNVFILYRLVRHFLFKPVKEIFRKRQEELDGIYKSAEELETKASLDKFSYEQKLATAQEQAEQIITAAQLKAQKEEKRILEETSKQSESILEKTKKENEFLKKQAMVDLQSDISDIAVRIAMKATGEILSKEDQEKLLEQSINCLERTAL